MVVIWIILTLLLIFLPIYWYLSDWKTTVKACSSSLSKKISYYGNKKIAFEACLRDRYGYRKRFALPYIYLTAAIKDISEGYTIEQVYNLPNLAFVCLCFDQHKILKETNPIIIYKLICQEAGSKGAFLQDALTALECPDAVIDIYERFVEYLSGKREWAYKA